MSENPVPVQQEEDVLFVPTSNYESQKYLSIDDNTLHIKPTLLSLAIGGLFALIGVGLVGYWAVAMFGFLDDTDLLPLLIFGLIFAAVGIAIYYYGNQQVFINRSAGLAFIRSWSPSVSLDRNAVTKHIEADEITAIQRVSRLVEVEGRKRRTTYTQHQVNLYTTEMKRHNVFVTLKPEVADNLGNQLAALFSVPIRYE